MLDRLTSCFGSARVAIAAVSAVWLFLCAYDAQPTGYILPDKVEEITARTKTTQATYSLYSWNKIVTPDGVREEWSAEFHSGNLHRVETPRNRIVADCAANTGTAITLATGKTETRPEWAYAACGINTNKKFLDAAWLGEVKTPFGQLDRIRLTDAEDIRIYDVRSDGVLVRSIYAKNTPKAPVYLVCQAVKVETILPDAGIFDKASLSKSFVSEQYRKAPASNP